MGCDSRGIEIKDTHSFFNMLRASNDTDNLDIDKFVEGCIRLKGMPSSIDVQSVAFEVKSMKANQSRFFDWSAAKTQKTMDMIRKLRLPHDGVVDGSVGADAGAG